MLKSAANVDLQECTLYMWQELCLHDYCLLFFSDIIMWKLDVIISQTRPS